MNYKISAIIITAYITILGCTEKQPIFNTEHMVHCVMVDGSAPKVLVTKTLDAFQKYPFEIIYYEHVSSMETKITMTNQNMVYSEFIELNKEKIENNGGDFNYYGSTPKANDNYPYFTNTDIVAKAGENYELKVGIIDYMTGEVTKEMTGNTSIPQPVIFNFEQLNHDIVYYEFSEFGDTNQVFKISFTDSPNDENFYYLLPYMVTLPLNQSIESVDIDSLWSNSSVDNHNLNVPEKPLLMPLDNFFNIDIIGIDGYDEYGINLQGLLFNDQKFNGQLKEIILKGLPIYFQNNSEQKYYMMFELFHVSESYYTYYNTLLKQSRTRTDPYAEVVQPYTNIENGVGLFAGVSVHREYIELIGK